MELFNKHRKYPRYFQTLLDMYRTQVEKNISRENFDKIGT